MLVHSRHTHLPAKSGKEDNELNWVNVIGNDDELRFLRLHKPDDVIETVLGEYGLLGISGGRLVALLLALLSFGEETSFLLLL